MLRKYLGMHKIAFKKDKEAEENETTPPNQKAIQVYLDGLKSQTSRMGQLSDEDSEQQEEEDMDEDDVEKELVIQKKTRSAKLTVSWLMILIVSFTLISSVS